MTLQGLRTVVNRKISKSPMISSKRIFKVLPKVSTPGMQYSFIEATKYGMQKKAKSIIERDLKKCETWKFTNMPSAYCYLHSTD